MTAPKTKRDRTAGRQHRHTAIQTIIDNHQGIIDDIAGIDNHIAALQGRTCDLGLRLDNWCDRLEEQNKHTRQNVAYTMRRVVENECKVAEIESALALLQESSKRQVTINKMTHGAQKEHQEAIAQLVAYTNKVHGKQVALNQEITLLQAEVDDTNHRLFQLAWITVALWAIAAITIFAYLITTH